MEYNLVRNGFLSRILPGTSGTVQDLEVWKPDLIVLDVMLPDIDGFEICRQIRWSPAGLRGYPSYF